LGIAAFLSLLVALLAFSPSYDGLSAGLDLQLGRLADPLHTYIFRHALLNTLWLLLGVYALSLLLGWTWAITGIPHYLRPFLLLPIFIPGALVGLLWRPLFADWLNLAQAELSLIVTALVILWRTVPIAASLFNWHRYAWPKLIPLCALFILLDGDLILTLSRGEPFNAAQTWPSWIVQQLWVDRAWGYSASMAATLALVIAALTWWAARPASFPADIPYSSPLGHFVAVVWIFGPFVMPLLSFVQAPLLALKNLVNVGALLWLLNGALLWGGTIFLASRFAWRLPSVRARRLARTLTLAMLPISTVALAYLADQLPLLGNELTLIVLTSLFSAGLLMSDENPPMLRRQRWYRAAGYAMLVIAHTFTLQLVMRFPAWQWSPAQGIVWTLAEALQSRAALGAALLLYGAWAGLGAWLAMPKETSGITR
jgi:hypothetical protein